MEFFFGVLLFGVICVVWFEEVWVCYCCFILIKNDVTKKNTLWKKKFIRYEYNYIEYIVEFELCVFLLIGIFHFTSNSMLLFLFDYFAQQMNRYFCELDSFFFIRF